MIVQSALNKFLNKKLHKEFMLGFQITKSMVMDDLYGYISDFEYLNPYKLSKKLLCQIVLNLQGLISGMLNTITDIESDNKALKSELQKEKKQNELLQNNLAVYKELTQEHFILLIKELKLNNDKSRKD